MVKPFGGRGIGGGTMNDPFQYATAESPRIRMVAKATAVYKLFLITRYSFSLWK